MVTISIPFSEKYFDLFLKGAAYLLGIRKLTDTKLRGVDSNLVSSLEILREPLKVSSDTSFHLLHLPS